MMHVSSRRLLLVGLAFVAARTRHAIEAFEDCRAEDYEFRRDAIGDRRIVLLGESSHGKRR